MTFAVLSLALLAFIVSAALALARLLPDQEKKYEPFGDYKDELRWMG